MQWSKLKTRIRHLICDELQDRIDFHLTGYRESHDGADKVWITVDGEKIFTCGHYLYERAEATAYSSDLPKDQIKSLLRNSEIHNPGEFGDSMRAYLDMPVKEALKSSNPLIQAFALIDRRTGKRAIEKFELKDSAHTLVKTFYRLRFDAIRI